MQVPRVAFTPIARPTFDIELAQAVTRAAYESLTQLPLQIEGTVKLITNLEDANRVAQSLSSSQPDLLLIFQATFADSSMIMRLIENVDSPILLWAVPEEHTGGRLRLNSFCGINLAGHTLTRAGRQYEYAFNPPGNPEVSNKILNLAKAGQARNKLRSTSLGRLGNHPDGFSTCQYDEGRIRQTFGMQIVHFNLETELFPQVRRTDTSAIEAIENQLRTKVSGMDNLDLKATRGTLGVYATLKHIAGQNRIGGYAVRCWPEFFTDLGCAACGAMALLSDEMIPCSCEADVNGTITQMILQTLSGEPAFGTDIVSIDEVRDALVCWHCGLAPLSMADPVDPIGTTVHSNRKLPLLFEFTLKPGTVTVARLTESSGDYRLVIDRAEIVRAPRSFSGTSGLLKFQRPVREILDVIMIEGLEHHISLTYGDVTEELKALADLLKIPTLQLTQ